MTEPPTDRDTAADQFAREHDPAQHDVSAGEEFRQRGDWTADEAGGEQVWDADGNLVEGAEPGSARPSAPATPPVAARTATRTPAPRPTAAASRASRR